MDGLSRGPVQRGGTTRSGAKPPQLGNAAGYLRFSEVPSKSRAEPSLRLFCFPSAGGGPSMFREWAGELPGAIQVCAIQLPGREARWMEPPLTRLATVVEVLVESLRPHLVGPFAFFGHSMGALVAFEVARQLRRQNQPGLRHLFVSGARAPQRPDPFPRIHHLPEAVFVEELRRLEGTPTEVLENAELMRLVVPTLRADLAICETYTHSTEPPLDCPISAYGGAHDRRVSFEDIVAWRVQTRNSFRVRMFPGNHFFLFRARRLLLRTLCQDLSPRLNSSIART